MTIQLRPTVYVTRCGESLSHRAQLHLTGGEPGQAVFHATLDGETRETVLTVTDGETTALVDIPCRETDETLCWRLTDAAGQTATGELLWKAQKRWEVHFIPITHHDLGYTQPVEPLFDTYCHYYDRVLDFCDQTADYPPEAQYRYTVEELWSLEEYLRRAPEEKREKLLRYVREGRIEISALYANVIDGLCSDEEILRLMYPSFQLAKECGRVPETACLVDIPGMSNGLIQALGNAGVKYLFAGFPRYFEWGDTSGVTPALQHGFWDEPALLPHGRPQAFYWKAPDGKRVLSWYQAGYGWFGNEEMACLETDSYDVVAEYLPRFLQEMEEKGCPYSVMRYIDHGSDNQMPQRIMADIVREWNERYAYPKLKVSTNTAFFHALEAQETDIPVWEGDLPHTDYPVLSLTAAKESGDNAVNRLRLDQVERLQAAVALLTDQPPLTEAVGRLYRDLILYDEHCFGMSLPMGVPHDYSFGTKQQYVRRVAYECEQIGNNAWWQLSQRIHAPEGDHLLVFNPADRAYSGIVPLWHPSLPAEGFCLVDEEGRRFPVQTVRMTAFDLPRPYGADRYAFETMGGGMLPFARTFAARLENIPAMGYRVYRVEPLEATAEATDAALCIENAFYRVWIEDGRVRIFDKEADRELTDPEAPFGMGEILCYDVAGDVTHPQTVTAVEKGLCGPLLQSLILRGHTAGCPQVVQEITLAEGEKRVEIAVSILKDAAPLQELFAVFPFSGKDPQFTYRRPLGEERVMEGQLPGSNTHHYTVQNWSRVETDAGVRTLSSLEARIFEYGQRRPTAVSQAHHGLNPAGFGDPFAAHPGEHAHMYAMLTYNNCRTNFATTQNGAMLFRFAIGSGRECSAESFAQRWQSPPLSCVFHGDGTAKPLPPSFGLMDMDAETVRMQCFKAAEEEGWILRLRETAGSPSVATVTLHAGRIQSADLCNALEQPEAALSHTDTSVTVTVPAHGVTTVRLIMQKE